MTSLRIVALFVLGALLYGTVPPRANADEWNKKTIVTVNAPVELPGVVLPVGTYVFQLLDSPSDRDIVEVFNQDESHIYATIMAIPDYRVEPTNETIITLEERPKDSPEAIKEWFYPGDLNGLEFVY